MPHMATICLANPDIRQVWVQASAIQRTPSRALHTILHQENTRASVKRTAAVSARLSNSYCRRSRRGSPGGRVESAIPFTRVNHYHSREMLFFTWLNRGAILARRFCRPAVSGALIGYTHGASRCWTDWNYRSVLRLGSPARADSQNSPLPVVLTH